MATGAVKLLLATSMVVLLHAASWAQDFDAGKYEYQTGCAPCHGTDGKGAGPVSSRFRVSPPDLTILAKKNNGVFPLNVVYEIIDGRKALLAHGTRDMPIWGDRYTPGPKSGVNPNRSDSFAYFSYDPEVIVRTRIQSVIDYLKRIQER